MCLPGAGQHVWDAIRVGDRRLLLIRHFMNGMSGGFLVYETSIGADMVFRRSRGYNGLCEIGDVDRRTVGPIPAGRISIVRVHH